MLREFKMLSNPKLHITFLGTIKNYIFFHCNIQCIFQSAIRKHYQFNFRFGETTTKTLYLNNTIFVVDVVIDNRTNYLITSWFGPRRSNREYLK
jgi:hypothetical protein